jgi:hypothetical protein
MSAYSDSFFEPVFSEPAPISAKKYRNGSRNKIFPSISVRFHPYMQGGGVTDDAGQVFDVMP